MKDLKVVRLSEGEELLCNLIEKNDEGIRIRDIGILFQNKDKIGLIPFIPFGKIETHGLQINSSNVSCILEPIHELVKIHEKTFQNSCYT
jgi:hypothetical protein